MPVITIPKALRDKLGDEAAESFAVLLKEVEHEGRKDALVLAEERFERRLSEEAASLRVKISEVKAELETKISEVKTDLEAKISEVEERFERRLSEEVASLRVKISEVKAELETKISEVKAELEAKISEVKVDIIKWMFIFWAGQIVVLIAILQIFFRK
ncbi:hypothetical protein A45J_1374 [hot springs metagenome]|uniref:DUF1640 domain-containing protein n=1 Tax=hot springs metagenome TaxID=433727 RepID=A0A5J4L7W8_9ZZZZ